MERRRLVQILVLLILAGGSRWLLDLVEGDDANRNALPLARSDYTLEAFDLLVMDTLGWPSFRVESPYLEKSPEDGSLDLETPVVFLYEQGDQTWRIDAERGWISNDGEQILLSGAVLLVSHDDARRLTIRTQNLRIFPSQDRASTDRPVRIERPGAVLDGVGLNANLETERIEILSEVLGRYDPTEAS